MARRRRAEKREVIPDPRYGNELVAYMINTVMKCGKKSTAANIVYGAIDDIQSQMQDQDPGIQTQQLAVPEHLPELSRYRLCVPV